MARRLHTLQASVLPLISLFAPSTLAIELNTSSSSSISSAAQTIASSLFATYYNADSTAGDFTQPQPWYWWLSGSAWTTFIDYTVFTNDTTYKANILTALAENIGENNDFAPAAQASWEANDGRHCSVDHPLSRPRLTRFLFRPGILAVQRSHSPRVRLRPDHTLHRRGYWRQRNMHQLLAEYRHKCLQSLCYKMGGRRCNLWRRIEMAI